MKIVIDTHTHTISSGHAYSTIQEMAKAAADAGIEMIAMTDHGPAMPGASNIIHFSNMKIIPGSICGVRVLKGVEANIINYNEEIDMPEKILKRLDFVMASFHEICIQPSTMEEHTKALIEVLKNPWVDAIAHPGNPAFCVDIDAVVEAARKYGKFLEINNHSFVARSGSEKNCREFAEKCKEHGVMLVCGSDAHICHNVGRFDRVCQLLEDVGVPEELVLNTSTARFDEFLERKRMRKENLQE